MDQWMIRRLVSRLDRLAVAYMAYVNSASLAVRAFNENQARRALLASGSPERQITLHLPADVTHRTACLLYALTRWRTCVSALRKSVSNLHQ